MLRRAALIVLLAALALPASARSRTQTYPLTVLPREDRTMKDPRTGVTLLFLSTADARENNLYFHQRSFLSDDSMALFTSRRKKGGLMGYLFATGELVRITTPSGNVGDATAAKTGNRIYATRGPAIVELALRVQVSPDPAKERSRVTCTERVITTVGGGLTASENLSENADGRLLACGAGLPGGGAGVITINVRSGEVRVAARAEPGKYHGHVQFSHVSPYLLSYAGEPRLMVVDTRTGTQRAVYPERTGELVTHESWWVGDQIVFCGGFRRGESDVKVLNLKTGDVRIIGAGAWWPEGSPAELAKWTWWHSNGHDDGRWIAADNWHGDIVVFDSKTTRAVPVTYGHRTYGRGEHPHVGWDRSGKRVIFTSSLLGQSHACVATLPE